MTEQNQRENARVVPSPLPKHILEIRVIEMLVRMGVIVICAGGGGIPVVCRQDGSLIGVEVRPSPPSSMLCWMR
jgi:carbamate kinase